MMPHLEGLATKMLKTAAIALFEVKSWFGGWVLFLVEEVEDRGALFFPEVFEEVGDDAGHADEGGED